MAADDMERNRQETGEPETSGQHGNPSGQQQGQLDQQKKGGQKQNNEEDKENLDRQRRAS
jgi:hypothetical protein